MSRPDFAPTLAKRSKYQRASCWRHGKALCMKELKQFALSLNSEIHSLGGFSRTVRAANFTDLRDGSNNGFSKGFSGHPHFSGESFLAQDDALFLPAGGFDRGSYACLCR